MTDLTGERVGDRVELHWTPPKRTTDGLELTPTTFMTAEICRDAAGPAPATKNLNGKTAVVACTTVGRVANQQGGATTPVTATDRLPADLTGESSAGVVLNYRVRVLNAKGRSADPSAAVKIPGGPPAAKVEVLNISQSAQGVVLEWRADQAAAGTVEVRRTLVAPPGTLPNPPQKVVPAKKQKALGPGGAGKADRQRDDAGEVRLRQDVSGTTEFRRPAGRDGMIDQGAVLGQRYVYSVQRVEARQTAGQSFEMRSEPTVSTTIEREDTFAPAPPRGLASVPGLLRDAADAKVVRATIDLSWLPGTEPDLAGYNVYRADAEAGAGSKALKLNQTTVPGPAYRDTTVVPGHRYRYTVTAIDRIGNESGPGAAVEDSAERP